MWDEIQSVVLSLGAPEILLLLLILGAAMVYFGRSKPSVRSGASPDVD